MERREFPDALLFSGILSSIGFPEILFEELECTFGPILSFSDPFPFTYTDYYDEEMGEAIERAFVSFALPFSPEHMSEVKRRTNLIESRFARDGKRKVNIDPGIVTEGSVILMTTKNRAHRIPLSDGIYAELTLIYHKKGYESFPWTYSDYKDERVLSELGKMRKALMDRKRV